jgi:hypothetical protein
MIPARQGFGTDKSVPGAGELRLVEDLDLAELDRRGQFLEPLAAAAPVGGAAAIRNGFGAEPFRALTDCRACVSRFAARVANRDGGP